MKTTWIAMLATLAAGPIAGAQDTAGELLVLRAGTVWTAAGANYAPGVVIVQDGKVTAVGRELKAPSGAVIVDFGKNSAITPGLVEPCAVIGLAGGSAEEGEEILPLLRVADGLDPESSVWQILRAGGVTSAYVTPSGRSLIGGCGAVVKTRPGEGALLVARSHMKATMGTDPSNGNLTPRFGQPRSIYYRRPTTRMGVTWEFRKAFFDALKYRAARRADANLPHDPAKEALLEVVDGRMTLRVRARLLQDIRAALRLCAEFGITPLIEEGIEAFRNLDELRAAGVTVLYGPNLLGEAQIQFGFGYGGTGRGGETDRFALNTAARLHTAGVPFALTAADMCTQGGGLVEQAALAVHFGLPRAAALQACTAVPAEILGVADRVGSLQPGKDADLLVWNGEPLELSSRPTAVMIDGRFVAEQE